MSKKERAMRQFQIANAQLNQFMVFIDKHPKPENPIAEGKWSPQQFGEHLFLAEKNTLKYLKYKQSQKPNYQKAGLITWFKFTLLMRRMKNVKPINMPTSIINPQGTPVDWEKMKKQWLDIRKGIYDLLNSQSSDFFQLETYKHPGVGRLTAEQMLRVFQGHIDRHWEQMRIVLN